MIARVTCKRADYCVVNQIQQVVRTEMAQRKKRPMIVDLTAVEVMSSLIMGALIELLQRLKNEGQRFVLVGLSKHVRASFSVARIDQMFEIHDSIDDAMRNISAKAWTQ